MNVRKDEYISLTDVAKVKNPDNPRFVIQNWMRTIDTISFIGLWEILNNDQFNRVEFDAVKLEVGHNYFIMTPKKWIEKFNAIGITSKSGKYGSGMFAHKDIAFEFASWISSKFKLYLITAFQRLKKQESHSIKWTVKRELSKLNYHIHTNAIKSYIIPHVNKRYIKMTYTNEADLFLS